MGNSPSNVNNDSDEEEGNVLQDITDLDGNVKDELDNTFDLGVLFNHKLLREATSKIKEEPTTSILQQHHGHILRWVEERRSRHEETITLSQFIDMLIDRGVEKDDAVELFNQFDAEGDGILDRDTLYNELNTSGSSHGQRGELRSVLKTLKACSICPGIIDAFVANKHSLPDHGKRFLKIILRNRASSMSIQTPVVEGFCNTTEMRLKVLQTHLQTIKNKAELKKIEPSCDAGEFLRPLTKCFSSTETSSNKADAFRLTNGDQSSYWQSDGPARSHWIRLRMRSNVVVKELSINVASADQSYMPQRVVVSGGRDEMNMRELNDVRIPSHVTGSVVLLENVKMPYPVIQINIRRCHSDGCDTRIRGVNAVGYRVVKSKGVSVADATAVWYVSVLTSTATMAMPVAPQLREMILNHTRTTLGHMVPLSLSITSPARPAYISTNVLDEMEKFLYSLACYEDKLDSEGMQVLIEFSLVRGNLGGIFKVLKLLYDNMHLKFTAKNIVSSLVEEQEKAIQRHGEKLAVGFVGCDGGSKDESSPPKNVLSDNWTTEAYYSEIGTLSLNMAFNSEHSTTVQLTKITLKVCKGGIGPRCGLVFMHNEVKITNGRLDVSHLDKYNDWDNNAYQEYLKTSLRYQATEDEPVAIFFLDNEWDEIDIHLDKPAVGKFIVVKFVGTRDPKAERMGILGIHFYGYEKTLDEMQESETWKTLTSIPENEQVSGSTLFLQVLLFLDCMAKDLKVFAKKKKEADQASEKEARLDMTKISLKQIWDVYSAVITSENENTVFASSLVLRLFHQALPFLKHDVHEKVEGDTKELSGRVFEHLCEVVDDQTGKYHRKIVNIAKDIILDGTEVFFPDANTRRDHLLSMVDEVMEEKKLQSLALTFESLCKFFSSKDASGLLGLPTSLTKSGFDLQSVLSVMSTLVSVAYQECQSALQTDFDPHKERKTSNLVQLLSAMQKSLLVWAKQQIDSDNGEGKRVAVDIVVKYTDLISKKACETLSRIGKCNVKDEAVTVMENSFVAFTFRQMVLFLNTFASVEELCLVILHNLYPVAEEIRTIAEDLPRYFMESNSMSEVSGDHVILRTWEMESSHNYENNQNLTKVFSCPGCSEFLVQFDSRCETERRYDYLEFTDSNGVKKKFDQKVGTEKWPTEVVFHSGNKLSFLFHSDGSNNEWGYKFTVTARGCPDITLSWLFDLQLGMASLFGCFCSSVMAGYPKDEKKVKEKKEDGDASLLQSNIWTTLFRGGFANNGKLQRSLSGHHATTFSADTQVHKFAKDLATDETGKCQELVKRCQESCGLPRVGGAKVDEAIRCVFAALLWHSQRLRDELVLYATDCPPETIPFGISEAYKTAESMRMNLVEARQKLILEAEEGKQKNGKAIDPDEAVTSCKDKALFLLKFSGLTRIASSGDDKERLGPKSSSKKNAFHRISIHHRRQRKVPSESAKASDKYPSFTLITDFVTNSSYSHTRVESLLKERKNLAYNLHKVYMFAAEYIRLFARPDIFQAPVVIFLQQMLVHQKIFPRHYGDKLEGCGLDLEGKVRKTYYTFLRRLLESVRSFTGDPGDDSARSKAFSCVRAYLLHFLDIEWKPYDLDFLNDINLPEFFLNTAKVTASALQQCSTELSDQRELEEYKENMAWKEQANQGFHEWWESMQTSVKNPDEKRRLHLFLSRYASLFDVDVFCDGCKSPLNRSRYRCLNCFEIDLCSTCFTGNVTPNGHSSEHEVVELRWKCDGCEGFIIGTRFNCNVCHDLDLCLGCYTGNKWPDRHTVAHSMKKFTKKTVLLVHERIPAYTHTHAWFQFSSLSLCLANALNDPGSSDTYGDYLYTTGILHGKCLSLIVKCLNEVLVVAKLTVKKEQEDVKQAALLKDTLAQSEGAATQPGTSEEGIVSKKSSETSSDISEIKKAEDKHDSEAEKLQVKDTEENKVDISEKDGTIDSTILETSKDAAEDSEKSGQTLDITQESAEISEDLKSDKVESCSEVKKLSESSTGKLETNSGNELDSSKMSAGTSDAEAPAQDSPSDTSLLSVSSSSNIPKGPTTTPSESHSDTINPRESSEKNKLVTSKSEPADSMTSVSGVSEESNKKETPTTSEPEPAESTTSVKNEKESGGAVAMVASGTSAEDKPEGLGRESAKLTQEQLETLFVKETQENLLGLIGAMVPKDSKLTHWTSYNPVTEDFLTSEFIPVLLKIVRSPDVLFTHRNMTIGVLGKYLQCIPPELCDKGVTSEKTDASDETEDSVESERHGKQTVMSLFQFGAECLARSDLESASSVACCLQQLCQSPQWQPTITFEITQSLAVLTASSEHPKLENIFGILVFAGFPNVLQMGSRVEIKEQSSEKKEGIALSYSTENASAVVADIKTRKRTSIKESNLQELSFLMELYCTSQFSTLLTIAQDILLALKEQGDQVPVERMWVLYLVLKAMLSNLKGSKAKDLRNDIMNSSLTPSLVALACKGTELSRMWLLRDLEILSIKLYKKQLDGTKKIPKPELVRTVSENAESATPTSSEPLRSLLQSFQEAIQAPMALLETILPRNDQARLLEEVHRSLWNEGNMRRLQNPTSKKSKEIPEAPDDHSIDIGVVRYSPGELQPKTFEAKEEDQRTCEKLMPSFSDEEIAENQRSLARLKSGNLLRAELDKDSPPELIKKVNKALCILYTRHVLSRLLAEWPEDRELTSDVLDSGDEVQLIGILDLLQRIETKEAFETVVTRVVNRGEAKLIKPLSLAAAHCMGEVKLSSETKETEHPYKNDVHKEDKVHIPGAATLAIKFDSRCSSEDGCDTLIMSSSQNYSEHRHEFSGQSGWIDFEIPGDTLYFVFQSDSTNTDWGWKFTVTGGQLGRFETGYTILKSLLVPDIELARSLPLKKLWAWLVSVACTQTGQQRLMATGLLLRVLLVSRNLPSNERPDLNLLNSLWALYSNMLEKETGGLPPTLVQPALRGLTELFLVVENLAQEWGIAEDLIVGLTTDEALRRCFTEAVWNVGAIGAAIDAPNKATEALKKSLATASTSEDKKKSGKTSSSKKPIPRSPILPIGSGTDIPNLGSDTSSDSDTFSDDDLSSSYS